MLELRNLCMRRQGRLILDDVNLALEKGEIRVLVGRSGAGKTSLLRCIAGLEAPDAGSVKICSEVVSEATRVRVPPHARGVAMSFQDGALWPHMSLERHLRFGLKGRIASSTKRDQLVDELFDFAQLNSRRRERPGNLSGGERQRVGLIRALAQQPKLLLLDEPLGHVDLHVRYQLARQLASYIRRHGITALWVTHQADELSFLNAQVSLLESGTLDGVMQMGQLLQTLSRLRETDPAVGDA